MQVAGALVARAGTLPLTKRDRHTRAAAKRAISWFCQTRCKRRRPHSTPGHLSPCVRREVATGRVFGRSLRVQFFGVRPIRQAKARVG